MPSSAAGSCRLCPRIVGLCLPVLAHSWHNGSLVVRRAVAFAWRTRLFAARPHDPPTCGAKETRTPGVACRNSLWAGAYVQSRCCASAQCPADMRRCIARRDSAVWPVLQPSSYLATPDTMTCRFSGGVPAYSNMFQLVTTVLSEPTGRPGARSRKRWPHFGPTDPADAMHDVGSGCSCGPTTTSSPPPGASDRSVRRGWDSQWVLLHETAVYFEGQT